MGDTEVLGGTGGREVLVLGSVVVLAYVLVLWRGWLLWS